ncbi:hypothetical protein [Armatimonas rosea]|uniref:Uncharacterized protein n=1 Tax=Armatimonas rosea TaxID=685828 RepID=A0A7W9SN69_ARMRO|nr:hypothetical protein [Armatimonas rosea]MBB6048944.1 hypothetical protein [Armatimonas rosea]
MDSQIPLALANFNVWYAEKRMLGTLRRRQRALGRFFAVVLLALQVFTQIGHYREHRPSFVAERHARHHAPTRHTDYNAIQTKDLCALCVLSSSSATLAYPVLQASRRLSASCEAPFLPWRTVLAARSVRHAPPRAPPVA